MDGNQIIELFDTLGLADELARHGRFAEVTEILETVADDLGSGNSIYLANLYVHFGQREKAEKLLDRYLAVHFNDPKVFHASARLADKAGDPVLARHLRARAIDLLAQSRDVFESGQLS
jgi:predicted Zn-dependent protease